MTIAELIAIADEVRPNQISKQTKTLWLSEIEHRVFDEVITRAIDCCPLFEFKGYEYDRDEETPLAVPDVYCDVYRTYLYSKIDMTLGEIDRYNADAAQFDAAWADFSAYYRREHYPKGRKLYGKIALHFLKNKSAADTTGGISGSGSEPRCSEWELCGYDERFFKVFPCNNCKKAQGDDGDSSGEP